MAYFANGTEGAMFEEAWCARCVHSDLVGDREPGDHPPCPVWMAHLLYAYELGGEESKEHPGKVILDMLITERWEKAPDGIGYPVQECRMFEEHREEVQ